MIIGLFVASVSRSVVDSQIDKAKCSGLKKVKNNDLLWQPMKGNSRKMKWKRKNIFDLKKSSKKLA